MLAGKVSRHEILGMLLNKRAQLLQSFLINAVPGQSGVLKVGLFYIFERMSEDHNILDSRFPRFPQ